MTLWFKLSASTVLATTALLASGSTAPASAAENGKLLMNDSGAQEQTVPAGTLQRAQAIQLVHNEIFPALHRYGLGDFLNTLQTDSAFYSNGTMAEPGPVWNVFITNENQKQSSAQPLAYFSAVLDAKTGELLSFEVKNPQWQGKSFPSAEVAEAQASDFLQAFEPNVYHELQLGSKPTGGMISTTGGANGQSFQYAYSTLNFYQKANGIPFLTNFISVNVDSFGHIVGMRKQFAADTSLLPSPANAISLTQANKIYSDALQMQKYYLTGQSTRSASGAMTWTANPKLVYLPTMLRPIDALSGQFQSTVPDAQSMTMRSALQLHPSGDKWNLQDLTTVQQMVSHYTQTDLSDWTYRAPAKDPNQQAMDDLTLEWDGPAGSKGDPRIFATEDAGSGQLISLRKITNSADDASAASAPSQKLTLQQGETAAVDFLQTLLPSGQSEVFLTSELDNSPSKVVPSWFDMPQITASDEADAFYSYQFNLGYEGVPILDQSVTVDVNPTNGAIQGFNRSVWHQVTLPENTGTVSADQVKQNFLQTHPLEFYYIWPQFHGQMAPQGELLYGVTPFASTQPNQYDAFTGKPVSLQP